MKNVIVFLLSTVSAVLPEINVLHAQSIPFPMPGDPSSGSIYYLLPNEKACEKSECRDYTICLYNRVLTADSITNTAADSSFQIVAETKFTWINKNLLCGRAEGQLHKVESPKYYIRDKEGGYYFTNPDREKIFTTKGDWLTQITRSGIDSLITDIRYGFRNNDTVYYFMNKRRFREGRMVEWWQGDFEDKKFKNWDALPVYRINRFDYQPDGMIKRTVIRVKRDSISGKGDTTEYMYHYISVIRDSENRVISAKLFDDHMTEVIAWYFAYNGSVCSYSRLDFNSRTEEIIVLRYDDPIRKKKKKQR